MRNGLAIPEWDGVPRLNGWLKEAAGIRRVPSRSVRLDRLQSVLRPSQRIAMRNKEAALRLARAWRDANWVSPFR